MRVLLLNSSQSKRPCPQAPWLRATLRATEHFAQKGCRIIASTGLLPWELVLWKAAEQKAPLHLLYPAPTGHDPLTLQACLSESFGFDPQSCTWEPVFSQAGRGRLKDTWQDRDALAFARADLLVPISIRPQGHLAALLQAHRKPVMTAFEVPYAPEPASPGWEKRRPWDLSSIKSLPEGWLIHFTRACHGPWPGESPQHYYQALATASGPGYPRSGFHTLCRILSEKRLRASPQRIRGQAQVVSFTALSLSQALGLIRYRPRFARYAFEPYGVALSPKAATLLDARPVVYDQGASKAKGQSRFSAFFQGSGPAHAWSEEQEWRVLGDITLSDIPKDELKVLTSTAAEAKALQRDCPYQVVCLGYREDPQSPSI